MAESTTKIAANLREQARLAWEEESRSLEAARQEAKARDEGLLAKKCIDVLGQVPTKSDGREGWIGSLRFRYKGDPYGSPYLCLVMQCSFCGDVIESRPIRSLADLGRNLEFLQTEHVCTRPSEPDPVEKFKERLVAALMDLMRDYDPDGEVL